MKNGVFFELKNGMKLALWPRTSLGSEARVSVDGRSPAEFAIAHNE